MTTSPHQSKHLTRTGAICVGPDGYWTCTCGKRYLSRTGFQRHLKGGKRA